MAANILAAMVSNLNAGHSKDRPFALLATTNLAKVREIRSLLADLPVNWLTLNDLGDAPDIEETGATFEANALLKARGYAAWSGLPSLADDGGLSINALEGEPGVKSRRWIENRDASDEELIDYTIERMRGVELDRRQASMRVVEAFVLPHVGTPIHVAALKQGVTSDMQKRLFRGDRETIGIGAIDGEIAELASIGRDPGFPFRSVFYLRELGKYYFELNPAEHEQFNHRRVALKAIRERIGS